MSFDLSVNLLFQFNIINYLFMMMIWLRSQHVSTVQLLERHSIVSEFDLCVHPFWQPAINWLHVFAHEKTLQFFHIGLFLLYITFLHTACLKNWKLKQSFFHKQICEHAKNFSHECSHIKRIPDIMFKIFSKFFPFFFQKKFSGQKRPEKRQKVRTRYLWKFFKKKKNFKDP
jgi:hypothetical protein